MELDELRELLRGVTWDDFNQGFIVKRGTKEFHGRYGLILNWPTLAIICDGKFVVLRRLSFKGEQEDVLAVERNGRPVITPDELSGEKFTGVISWVEKHDPPIGLVVPASSTHQGSPLAMNEVLA